MILCKCGELAEVVWEVVGQEPVRQSHNLCSNCMSKIWEMITLQYQGSAGQQQSIFTAINQ